MHTHHSAFVSAVPVLFSSRTTLVSPALSPFAPRLSNNRRCRLVTIEWEICPPPSARVKTESDEHPSQSKEDDSSEHSSEHTSNEYGNGEARDGADVDDGADTKASADESMSIDDGSGNGRSDDDDDGGGGGGDDDESEDEAEDLLPGNADPPHGDGDQLSGDRDQSAAQKKTLSVMLAESVQRLKEGSSRSREAFGEALSSAGSKFAELASQVFENVPPPIIVAFISLISTLAGTRYKIYRDHRKAERERAEASRKRKEEIERNLRETYELYASPLLKSSAKLAERLEFSVNADWSAVEDNDGEKGLSPTYSAYLLGRFLAHVEILKRERALLDYGFPTADRILANILGRIQGVLCANDKTLINIQQTEHFFKPYPGEKPLGAGPLKISPRKQAVLGELMLRRSWGGKYDIVKTDEGSMQHGSKAVLTFLEFSHIFNEDKRMQRWYNRVKDEFENIEKTVNSTMGLKQRSKRLGARIYFFQSALLDLVEFFDPIPHPQSIPIYQRKRLQIGPNSYKDEVRSPLGLRKLYEELANFREHREHANSLERLKVPYGVEVFVTGRYDSGNPSMELSSHGNCPNSHRVLITLREMNIPYQSVPIAPDNKPAWFYLLHPMTQTPLIYHEGKVITESTNIVSYLIEKFPKNRQLSSSDHLRLAVGSAAFVRFHDHMIAWLCGDDHGRVRAENELGQLETVLKRAQAKNGGTPFFGGAHFSREDTAVVPFLHNVEVVGRRLKNWSIPKEYVAVKAYLKAAREMPSFSDSGAEEEAVIRRVEAVIGRREQRTERLADMLE